MEIRNRKKKRSLTWNLANFTLIMFVLMLMYIIGYSQGQASVYEKRTDDNSLEELYKIDVKVKE
jgi:hypothetical protein